MAGKVKITSSKEKRKNIINCVIAVIVAILFLFPIYWILAMSFKSDAESFGKLVTYYPHHFTLEPWIKNFQDAEFLSSLRNSVCIAFLSMVISLVFGIPAAFQSFPIIMNTHLILASYMIMFIMALAFRLKNTKKQELR